MLPRRTLLGATLDSMLPRHGQEGSLFARADAYERFMGRWSRLLAPLLVKFSGVRDEMRLLDVGCGTGALSFAAAGIGPRCRIEGIDPSAEYVRYASAHNPFPGRVRFRVGDARQTRFAAAEFDGSLSLLVFNFIEGPGKAVAELRRITRPGGSIAAAVWDYAAGMRMLRVFWDAVVETDPASRHLDEADMPLCKAGELGALWRVSGLLDVTEQPLGIKCRFSSFDDYWGAFLQGQGPAGAYIRSLDQARLHTLRDAILSRLALRSPARPFTLPARAWAVRGSVPAAR